MVIIFISEGIFLLLMFCIFLFVLILALWLSCVIYRFAFHSPNHKPRDPYAVPPGKQYEAVAEQMLRNIALADALEYEQIYIESYDGLRLAARYYPLFDRGPVQIYVHGYRGNALREFANCLGLAQKFGFNVLLIDQRGNGDSDGHTISFGVRERYDCRDWAWYVYRRFGREVPILLSGVSMGAATVLMASDLKLPPNVAGILADCPFSSPGAILRCVCEKMHLPVWLAYPGAVLGALIYGHFCIWRSSAMRSVAHTKIPIMLVHGDADRLVPFEMSKRIFEACIGEKTFLEVKGAGHGLSYLIEPGKYEATLEQFFCKSGLIL